MTKSLSAISGHLASAVSIVSAQNHVTSLLLLGSAARDELSFLQRAGGRVELFSDYEFLVVTEAGFSHAQYRALSCELSELEQQIANPNPLFHIDLIVRQRSRLKSLPPIVFTFELKQNGVVLYGEDVRAEIPDVTLQNLDLSNTYEILYKRLWAILLHLPWRFVLGQAREAERRVTGYVLCRNALDLPTVLLPREGVLLPTYGQRIAHLCECYPALRLAQVFGPKFPQFMQDCLDRRLDLDFANTDLWVLYNTTLDCLERGLGMLLPQGSTDLTGLPIHSQRVFNEWPISRGEWYNLARLTVAWTRQRGLFPALRWLRLPKKGWLTLGLLAMHRSLRDWWAGDAAGADHHLVRSGNILQILTLTSPVQSSESFLQRWLALREGWGAFWWQYIRLGSASYVERFARVMEWTDE